MEFVVADNYDFFQAAYCNSLVITQLTWKQIQYAYTA